MIGLEVRQNAQSGVCFESGDARHMISEVVSFARVSSCRRHYMLRPCPRSPRLKLRPQFRF
jgi:hypothetical protein